MFWSLLTLTLLDIVQQRYVVQLTLVAVAEAVAGVGAEAELERLSCAAMGLEICTCS